MITERIWEGFDLSNIKNINVFGDPSLVRLFAHTFPEQKNEFGLPSYEEIEKIGDFDKLWIGNGNCRITITFGDGTRFIYTYYRGFVFDKASVPIGKDNIAESAIPARVHDVGCSTHCLDFLAINNDKGFRANNILFHHSMLWFIEREDYSKRQQITGKWKFWRRFLLTLSTRRKRKRAKLWYLAVNSIAGQGFYERNERDWHKKTTQFEVINP